MALPSYFEHFGRIEPTDRRQTPLVFAAGKLGSTAWEVLHSDETKRTNFMLAMAAAESMPAMQTGYDFSWIALEAAQSAPDRVVCVDVGGGKGHALKRIMRANPTLPRHRFALEDLPDVLEQAGREDAELDGVQLVPIDFHLEQPIKGALVYHIRRCLHDYSDGEAVLILQRIAAAMARDSKLLVLELVVEDPPTAHQAMTDLMVMSLSGKERTLADWRGIVGRAGLTITRVSTYDGGHSVIECALA
ncbi:89cd9361-5896-4b7c-a037-8cc05b6952fa [Thermothielavioides terrestris]|nr:89cd9361-5896-4b7c-a037-8cc05b6952fa [Thermothielavioides terrestris]